MAIERKMPTIIITELSMLIKVPRLSKAASALVTLYTATATAEPRISNTIDAILLLFRWIELEEQLIFVPQILTVDPK